MHRVLVTIDKYLLMFIPPFRCVGIGKIIVFLMTRLSSLNRLTTQLLRD